MRIRDMWKSKAGLGVLVLVLGMASRAMAQPPPPPGGPGGPGGPPPPPPGPRMGLGPAELGQLGLSDDQQTQIKTLLDQQRDERRGSMDEARAVQQQLGTAIFGAAAADTAQLTELTTKLADLQRQGLEAEVAMQVKIAAVLTDTQRQQLLAMRAAREAAGPRGPGGPGGRGPRTR